MIYMTEVLLYSRYYAGYLSHNIDLVTEEKNNIQMGQGLRDHNQEGTPPFSGTSQPEVIVPLNDWYSDRLSTSL